MTVPQVLNPPRRRWRMLLPLAALLLLAALWSGGWFYAAGKAEMLIDAALAREAARGRTLACGDKRLSGFPFRIVVDCSAPRLTISRGTTNASLAARHLKAAVQVYRPNHLIAELTGPLRAEGGGATGLADWQSAQASFILALDAVRQADIAVNQLQLFDATGNSPVAAAKHAEAHLRQGDVAMRDFDMALIASDVTLHDMALPPQLTTLKRAELAGIARGVPPGISEDAAASLRLWQQNQGKLEIARLFLDTGETAVLASGMLVLEDSGRPSGTFKAALANAPALAGANAAGPVQLIMTAMQFLGRKVELDGRQAVEIDITVEDGVVRIGPARLGPLPPLY